MIHINYTKSNGELKRLKELSAMEDATPENPATVEELQEEIKQLKEIINNLKGRKKK